MRTSLWQRAFSSRGDSNDKYRERYQSALLRFRERVGSLLTFIPGDMKQYTVHDLSHLDALWEMAELIAGAGFTLNPAEAFVFGGAVLLHDAGMSVAAYPGGLEAIKAMPEWSDSYSWACSTLKVDPGASQVPGEVRDLAITDVLRKKHAMKADELATQTWSNSLDQAQDYLIEDSDLRSHFGPAIGAIAHSHHWGVRHLLAELQSTLGAFGETPSDWAVDGIKVALLLRCADAAHLDHRRAPRLLFALTQPAGVARTHWTFQAKLAKPQARDGKLLYTSRSAFALAEVDAWHLCWDMMKMVDRELSDSCDVLLDRKIPPFWVSGVVGAKSADALAKHVLVEGWRPIPTELQVSDVPHLARTLGGRDLYSSPIAPLRELLQNAADAIDARAALDGDFVIPESRITVKVAKEDGVIVLSVEDDGLGMSERTLTGALLDFGTSFWKSDAARNEFPGLQARFEPRGRYGIGFFSVFMWADSVKVSSRKFNEGISDARVLEFTGGLGSRPILRPAAPGEASTRFSTKVSLQILERRWNDLFARGDSGLSSYETLLYRRGLRYSNRDRPDQESTVSRLTAMLRMPVYFGDSVSTKIANMPDWEAASSDQFISFLEKLEGSEYSERIRRFAKSESLIKQNGKVVGRAFLCPSIDNSRGGASLAFYELGILVRHDLTESSVHGFVEGRAKNAARDRVEGFKIFSDFDWVEKQIDYMTRISENLGDAIACQESLIRYKKIARQLPIVLLNRKERSLDELIAALGRRSKIRFSLAERHDEKKFGAAVVDSVAPFIGKDVDEDKLYFLVDMPDEVTSDELEWFIAEGDGPLAQVVREIKNGLGSKVEIRSTVTNVDDYSRRQVLTVEMRRSSDSTS
ncbi:HD domain-containing protein [Burkholderia pyrrocinia]